MSGVVVAQVVVTVDLNLQPGSVKETVVVTAEASLLQTATAEVSFLRDPAGIRDLAHPSK